MIVMWRGFFDPDDELAAKPSGEQRAGGRDSFFVSQAIDEHVAERREAAVLLKMKQRFEFKRVYLLEARGELAAPDNQAASFGEHLALGHIPLF